MIQLQQRQFARTLVQRGGFEGRSRLMQPVVARTLERFHVPAGNLRPSHLPAKQVCPLAHCVSPNGIVQQRNDRLRDCRRVFDRHQHAAVLGEQFLSMPVGCGNHGLARAHRISERSRNDLVNVGVRRDIEVCRPQKLHQLLSADEPIVEDHAALNTSLPGQLL